MTKLVKALKRHTLTLIQTIQTIDKNYAKASAGIRYWLSEMKRHVLIFHMWVLWLSEDPEVCIWMPWHDIYQDVSKLLVPITEFSLIASRHWVYQDDDVLLKGLVRSCCRESYALCRIVSCFLQMPSIPQLDITYVISPYALMHTAAAKLALPRDSEFPRSCVFTKLPSNLSHTAPIRCNISVISLLEFLLKCFFDMNIAERGIEEPVLLTFKAEDNFAVLRLTHKDLRMSPHLWDEMEIILNPVANPMQTQPQSSLNDHLREAGVFIEPLTWDEGEGQGVIVRLPWAHLSP